MNSTACRIKKHLNGTSIERMWTTVAWRGVAWRDVTDGQWERAASTENTESHREMLSISSAKEEWNKRGEKKTCISTYRTVQGKTQPFSTTINGFLLQRVNKINTRIPLVLCCLSVLNGCPVVRIWKLARGII